MAEYSRFFGGPGGAKPEYNQPEMSEVLKCLATTGVFKGKENELEVTETDPQSLAVRIKTGKGWIEGFWYYNDDNLTKTLSAADPDNPRIDRVVLRLSTVTYLKISVEILTGAPAANPVPPSLTQGADVYEISLAQVRVNAGVTSVNNSNITDERAYTPIFITDGWTPANEIWIYTSATSLKIEGDKRTKYQKGDKVKLTQSTVKYFYINSVTYSSGFTTLWIFGFATLANEVINYPCYSKIENPQGFPNIFPWITNIKARVFRNAEQSDLVNGTWTKVQLNAQLYNPGNYFDKTTNFRFTSPITGYYQIIGSVSFANLVADKRYLAGIYQDGTLMSQGEAHAAVASNLTVSVSDILLLSKDSYVELWAQSNAGANTVDIAGSAYNYLTYMAIHLISI
jgi:hypothetical protein